MISLDTFNINMSNGMTLEQIISINNLSDTNIISILTEYSNSIFEYGEDLTEFLFYEEEDINVLRRFGFDNLIGN
tara:strand:- start:1502 stop:1726 length:225 start_codon:yes stop_codon:yes gene_type:complete